VRTLPFNAEDAEKNGEDAETEQTVAEGARVTMLPFNAEAAEERAEAAENGPE
jgi:hypothetical protein